MSRPVSYNVKVKPLETDISMSDMPEGHMGEGFFATSFDKVIGLARKIHFGHCLLQLPAVELNLWLPWALIMILEDSVLKELVFLHASVIC